MPCFRGIELCIVGQPSTQRFPEFSHPDASSVRLGSQGAGTVVEQGPSDLSCLSSVSADNDRTHIPKSKPTISVYIPSQPGVQFWIKYNVTRPPPDHAHLYFKMYINGRHITSWGINPRVSPNGYVVRAFYDAAGGLQDPGRGVAIEGRYFCFKPEPESTSIAEDGGLIELNVFRAKARKRRPVQLDMYRDQEVYGIAAPSGGILRNPDAANFYDWYISDPKDSPYATFRFHYRSWTNLQTLNIIPPSLSRNIASTPYTRRMTAGAALHQSEFLSDSGLQDGPHRFSFGPDFPTNTTTEVGVPEEEDGAGSKLVRSAALVFDTRPLIPPPHPLPAGAQHVPQPSKASRDAAFADRPLPKLPEMIDTEENRSRSSSMSSTPEFPVTASLRKYADTPIADNESVEIGVARTVAISHCVTASKTPGMIKKKSPGSLRSRLNMKKSAERLFYIPTRKKSTESISQGGPEKNQVQRIYRAHIQKRSTEGINMQEVYKKKSTESIFPQNLRTKQSTERISQENPGHKGPSSSSLVLWRASSPKRFGFSGRRGKETPNGTSYTEETAGTATATAFESKPNPQPGSELKPLKKKGSFSDGKQKAFSMLEDAGGLLGVSTKRSNIKLSESEWMKSGVKGSTAAVSSRTSPQHQHTGSTSMPHLFPEANSPKGLKEGRKRAAALERLIPRRNPDGKGRGSPLGGPAKKENRPEEVLFDDPVATSPGAGNFERETKRLVMGPRPADQISTISIDRDENNDEDEFF